MTEKPSRARLVAGYGAVAATLPYLVLKILWLSGVPVGFVDRSLVHDGGLVTLNVVTAAMDAVALLLALTFTHRWGSRAPVWLIAPPMWVGAGLLAPIAVAAPVAGLVAALGGAESGASDSGSPGPVQMWVYAMVYTGFVGESVALLTAFVLYARRRWPDLFRLRVADWGAGATAQVQLVLGGGAAGLAVVVGAVDLAWACGVTFGLPDRVLEARTPASSAVQIAFALFGLVGAAGLSMLLRRTGRRAPLWVALVMAWSGSGSLFAWGAWSLVNVLGTTVLAGEGAGAASNFVDLLKMLAGLLIGVVGAVSLADRPALPDRVPPRLLVSATMT